MERFSKVSHILKLGNFPNFARDLHHRLEDLEYTETHMASSQKLNAELSEDNSKDGKESSNEDTAQAVDGSANLTLEAIQQAIGELKATIDQVEHHPVLFSSKTQESESEQSSNFTGDKEIDSAKKVHDQQAGKEVDNEEKQRSNSVASSVVAMTRTVSRGLSSVTDMLPFKGPWSSAFLEQRRSREPQMNATAEDISNGINQTAKAGNTLDNTLESKYEVNKHDYIFSLSL